MRFGLDKQEYLGTLRVPGSIWDLGSCPGLNFDGNPVGVVCDAFEVLDQHVLDLLDMYEGYSPADPARSLYLRRSITTDEFGDVFIYEYNQQLEGREGRVEDGDWTSR